MTVRLLFVHQNFPSQFEKIADHLAKSDEFEVAALGTCEYSHPSIKYHRYALSVAPTLGDLAIDDAVGKMRRAAAVSAQARLMRLSGYEPDIIVVHPGWGEALYLKDVFPKAKLVCYCEYYYQHEGGDVGFDPEFPLASTEILHRLRIRNALQSAAVEEASVSISPTRWQRSTYPATQQPRIQVIHDGIDLARLIPGQGSPIRVGERMIGEDPGQPILTYVARHLEPHRGFHVFMRALPEVLEAVPNLEVLIVGSQSGGYGSPPAPELTWRQLLWREVGKKLDRRRVHFLGWLAYDEYLNVLRLSHVHVYLTYPFVLSWSALEAMALGCTLIGSRTPPVCEFMQDGVNARLVDFFDTRELAGAIRDLSDSDAESRRLSQAAVATVRDEGLALERTNKLWTTLLREL